MKYKSKYFLKKVSMALFMGVLSLPTTFAGLIFTTEDNAVNSDNFILDFDDTSTDFIDLEFGDALTARLRYDVLNDKFILNRDLELTGNLKLGEAFIDKNNEAGSAGQILSSTTTGTDWINNTQIMNYTGRSYLNTDNRWVSWSSNYYGPNYYQWKQSSGTGTNPTVSWAGIGMWLPKGTRITGITLTGRANNTEVTDIEHLWQFRYPNPITRWETGMDSNSEYIAEEIYRNKWWNNTTAGQPAFSGAINDIHSRHYDVDYVTPEGGWVDQVLKPVGTLTKTRYFYSSTTIEYILPTDL